MTSKIDEESMPTSGIDFPTKVTFASVRPILFRDLAFKNRLQFDKNSIRLNKKFSIRKLFMIIDS